MNRRGDLDERSHLEEAHVLRRRENVGARIVQELRRHENPDEVALSEEEPGRNDDEPRLVEPGPERELVEGAVLAQKGVSPLVDNARRNERRPGVETIIPKPSQTRAREP